jgi:hypothetical protein
MTHKRLAFLTFACAASLAAPLAAQSPPGGQDGTYYAPDDPLRQTKLKIEEMMGIYGLAWPQRDVDELILIDAKRIDARVWVSIGARGQNELTCKALRWLLLGRHQWSLGARGVFGEFPDLQTLRLTFLDVRLNREGDNGKKSTQTWLSLEIDRADFNNLDLDALNDALDNDECTLFVRRANLRYSFDKDYYNKYLQER